MSEKMDAARSIRNLATLYREMDKAATALEAMGSIEQATEKAKAELVAAQKATDKARLGLESVQESAQARSVEVNAQIADAIDKAKAQVAETKKNAEIQAAETVKRGQDEAAKLVADASTEKARLSSEVGGLQRSSIDLKAQIEALLQAKIDAEKQLADVNAKLDAMKGKLKAFLE
jgi:predicted  nucleic acid-binding Zn-ribbon protein